ncbi:hypothetical protein B5X24_HaOG200758 [Helicoverpa armigera]|nr:hypothetical protein B5X24_HaOG200758 [Helicoverpa armigera]
MNLFYVLIFCENFMCVYRNYFDINKYQRIVAITRIIVELTLSVVITAHNVLLTKAVNYESTEKDVLLTMLFQILTLFKSIVIIIGGIMNSESFKQFYENLRKLYHCFENDVDYKMFEKKLRIKSLVGFSIFTFMSLVQMFGKIFQYYFLGTYQLTEIIVLVLYELWVDMRYSLEHVVVFCAISCISDFLKCLNISVNKVLMRFSEQPSLEPNSNEENVNLPEKVNNWTEKYQKIMACCKNISLCYQELVSNHHLPSLFMTRLGSASSLTACS